MVTVAAALRERLLAALERLALEKNRPIEVVPSAETRYGDYQTNVAMVLAQELRTNPRSLAERIIQNLDVGGISQAPELAGPGFINFRLSAPFLATRTQSLATDPRLGVEEITPSQTVIIDFSSPNIAKPMHVGHIRSTIIGDAIARIARFLGYRVITDNHLGDWGTQFGKVIYGWKHFRDDQALALDPVKELVRLYQETDRCAKLDPKVLEGCRAELVKLQAGDQENRDIWQKCVDFSKAEFAAIYQALRIHFDVELGESFYHSALPEIADQLLSGQIAEISEGALVVWDRELGDTPFMIRKSDGGFGYASTDVATLKYRIETWQPDQIWYVVGLPQQLHFKQLFSVARRLGYGVQLHFIGFGSILGEDKKLMRTRSGENVALRDLLQEAITRAAALVREKNPEITPIETAEVSQIVGLGAIKFAELSQHRMTDYVFEWGKMLSFNGNTAPYLQYAYVRSRAIFRRLGSAPEFPAHLQLSEPAEEALSKKICQFAEVLPKVLDGFKPNLLANYLYELASEFHNFFERCPVLKAPEPARSSRLLLCDLFARTLRTGLDLLGIEVPERM